MTTSAKGAGASWRELGYWTGEVFPDVLGSSAERFGSTPVSFVVRGRTTRLSVAELHRRSTELAAALQEIGVRQGDVVAVQLPNLPEAAITYQAVLLTGAVLLPIVHVYGAREVEFILRESGAKVLVMPDAWGSADYLARLPRLRAIDTLQMVAVVGERGEPGTTRWQDLVPENPVPAPVSVRADEVCLLTYTSGTTAAPKGVQHTHESMLAELRTQPLLSGSGADAVQLACFPSGHIAGLLNLFRALMLGTPTVFMDGWQADKAVEIVAAHEVTCTSGSPYHLASLLEALDAGAALGSLRQFLVGAATVPAELVARADAAGIAAYRSYGSTEHPTIASGYPDDPLPKRQFTDGRATPGTLLRIVRSDGTPAATGEDGEVQCRGPEQFAGYRDPGLDEGVWTADGWMRTGDIGRLDAEGHLTITDRAKDVIIRGGETISSREVEDVLLGCPGVVDAAAVAVPDPRYGEKVGAVVVVTEGAKVDLQVVQRHFAEVGTARQKTPEYLDVVPDLPRTAVGKVRKAELRKRWRVPE